MARSFDGEKRKFRSPRKCVSSANVVGKKLTAILCTDPSSFWENAKNEIGVALQGMSLELMDVLDMNLSSISSKISQLEITTKKILATRDALAHSREEQAAFVAECERSEKSLLSQWLQSFVGQMTAASSTSPLDLASEVRLGLDAIDFAFCRYALNVALSSPYISENKIIKSRIPHVLVGIIEGANATLVSTQSPSSS